MPEADGSSVRADVALVRAGLFDSRARAQAAIAAGRVTADGAPIAKASVLVPVGAVLRATPAHPWVSRGGLKLAAALEAFGLTPAGGRCLDVGASTGGFSQVLLAHGAAHVTAIDVGHSQLHPSLRNDPRLTLIEHRDARALTVADLGTPPDWVVVDVSFISLHLVLPAVLPLAAAAATLVALVKPQFEAGPARVRKGVVRDEAVHREVCDTALALVTALGWRVLGLVPSPVEGGDGNKEFLLGAQR